MLRASVLNLVKKDTYLKYSIPLVKYENTQGPATSVWAILGKTLLIYHPGKCQATKRKAATMDS